MLSLFFLFHTDSKNEENEYTLEYCQNLTAKISSLNDIPQEYKQYSSICEALLRRRDSNKHDYAIAFEGMSSGQALSAMAAREKGHLNPIQIQRRFTNRKPSDRRVW